MLEYIERKVAQQALIDLPAELDAEAVQRCIETVHNLPAANVRENVQPKTMGDRLRTMTNKELARKIVDMPLLVCPPGGSPVGCTRKRCYDCWLNWLQSPAKGGYKNGCC